VNKKTFFLLFSRCSATKPLSLLANFPSFPELDKNGRPLLPRPMPHLVYSPTDLAHSGVALPLPSARYSEHQHHPHRDATKMTVFASVPEL